VQLLSSGNFLSRLSSFPVDSLNEETVELVQSYLQSSELEVELSAQTCGTLVSGLYSWAQAICSYYKVNKKVIHTKVSYYYYASAVNTRQQRHYVFCPSVRCPPVNTYFA